MHHHPAGAAPFIVSSGLWFAMMAAMMAPTVWPWVRSFHRFGGGSTVGFGSGYLAAWVGYSLAAATLQLAVHTPSALAPFVLVTAGAYQFASLKRACLTHCRNPIGYFVARWRNGPAGGFRMGLAHGLYCVGCCWAMMATMLVVGATSVWWMIVLGGVAFVEQVVPHGHTLRVPIGAALIAWGLLVGIAFP